MFGSSTRASLYLRRDSSRSADTVLLPLLLVTVNFGLLLVKVVAPLLRSDLRS